MKTINVAFIMFFLLVSCSSVVLTEEEINQAIKQSFLAGYKTGHKKGCESAMEYANIVDDMGVCHVMTEAQMELIKVKVEETKL